MQTLTMGFNEISVKKDEKFAVELPVGGLVGFSWESVTVESGNAHQVSEHFQSGGRGFDVMSHQTHVFQADKKGDVEIVAHQYGERKGKDEGVKFKVHVL